MASVIYYFTGTGNSLAVAKDIADKINADLIPLASAVHIETAAAAYEVIGFVFPVYDFKPPGLLLRFLDTINVKDSSYTFAVCTYGISPLKALENVNRILLKEGNGLSSGFAVRMPHNGLGSDTFSAAENNKMFLNWRQKLESVCEVVNSRRKQKLENESIITGLVLSGILFRRIPFILRLLKQVIKEGWNSLAFTSDENCTGCGICEKICPVNNISMRGKIPAWSDHCEGCFACYHWCPLNAVRLGRTDFNMKQYHNPDVVINELIRQKQGR